MQFAQDDICTVCHVCQDLLLRRKSFRDKILDVETKLRSKSSASSDIEIMVPPTTSFAPSLTSTPTGHQTSKILVMGSDDAGKCLAQNVTKPCSDEVHETPQRKMSKSAKSINFGGNGQTQVTVRVSWTSKVKERKLPCDLASLGKMLCRRTYKQIANTAWRHDRIRGALTGFLLKEIDRECRALCSKGSEGNKKKAVASVFRCTGKEDVVSFRFEKMKELMLNEAPLFWHWDSTVELFLGNEWTNKLDEMFQSLW